MFVLGKPLKFCVIPASKAGAYPRGVHLKHVPRGKAPTLFANIALSWKGLQGAKTQAYLAHIRGGKSFVNMRPESGVNH